MSRKGQALVEFLIIFPIFPTLVLGVIDMGKILYNKTGIKNKKVNIPTEYPIIFFIILPSLLL